MLLGTALLLPALLPGATLENLRTEYLVNPLGLDKPAPRFTWELHSAESERGLNQISYQIKVGGAGAADGSVWDSGKLASNSSFLVKYAGPTLKSGVVYHWTVSVVTIDAAGTKSSANAAAHFSTGMLTRAAWGGSFIGMPSANATMLYDRQPPFGPTPMLPVQAPWFRKTFQLPAGASGDALVYVASVGYHELSINGQPATDAVLLPSISYLPKRVLYRTYNVSSLLKPGAKNTLGVWASAGWAQYPDELRPHNAITNLAPLVLARLEMGTFSVVSDGSWTTHESTTSHAGPPFGSGGFGGDAIDDNRAQPGWDTSNHDDSAWQAVAVHPLSDFPHVNISADAMEPTVRHSSIAAKSVAVAKKGNPHFPPPPPGSWLVEMDQVFTGWFEVSNMKGSPNSTVRFQVSTTGGVPMEYNMQDSYTFGPSGVGKFRMRFAYHEIQYITISGLHAQPALTDVIGHRLTSLGQRTGDFSCSSELMSKMYDTTVNNYRGLTTGGMTVDCPHRERRGYGGDGHTSYQFALANYPVGPYFNKWMRDFADTQGVAGASDTKMPACTTPGSCWVPNTAPTVSGGGGPAWSGFVITNPWQTYNTFGDTNILEDMYPTMESLLAFYAAATHTDDGLMHSWAPSTWVFLGDWITPHGSEGNVTSPENILFNNCYLHYITKLTAEISSILGYPDKAEKYHSAATKLAAAVTAQFGDTQTGVYLDMLQTHSLMPLASGLVPPNLVNKTISNLAYQITVTDKGHLDTGLTGTYFLFKYLMESGRNDLAFVIANQTTFPSYGYFLAEGYTTWPEQWDVTKKDLSKMHGCFNGIGLWFIEGIAGAHEYAHPWVMFEKFGFVQSSSLPFQGSGIARRREEICGVGFAYAGIRVHASENPPLTIRAGVDAGDITSARGQRAALHGQASSSWALLDEAGVQQQGGFVHNVSIPGNAVARVLIPTNDSSSASGGVTESGKAVDDGTVVGVTVSGREERNGVSYVALRVLSGSYSFGSSWTRPHHV